MKRAKKAAALSLSIVLGCSLCACGSGIKEENTTTAETSQEVENASSEETVKMAMPETEGEIIYVYSWDQELGDRLQYFKEAYPEYADRVEYVNLGLGGTSSEYQTAIETLLQAGTTGTDKYPSIIATDSDLTLNYVQSDYTLPMSELGIGEEDYANMYPYTVEDAKFDGQVKALTWQATPGCFIYRTDIAEEVLGTSDPEAVQKEVGNWNKFFNVADRMKEAGYKMLSGPDDIKYAMLDQKKQPWVFDEILNIDPVVTDYLEYAKKLYDGDYTNQTKLMDSNWENSFDSDVFCWFGAPWFVYWCINAEQHMGEFKICEGPSAFHWGGTYLNVAKDCPDKELAALVVKTLCCDDTVMQKITEDTKDFVNNKTIMEQMSQSEAGNIEMLGGQNPISIWMETADKIDLSNATAYDAKFNGYLDTASEAYNADELGSVEDAVEAIKDFVSDAYNYITVE